VRPLQCPSCNQSAMSAVAKLGVGPLRSKPCQSCGQNLSVAWLPYMLVSLASSLFPFVAVLLAIVTASGSLVAALVGVIVFSLPALWLHYRLVPLVARSLPSKNNQPQSEQR